ncbi:MAG: hypothetical protein WCC17_15565 [Candidatus Nitrosopolaris sp.]
MIEVVVYQAERVAIIPPPAIGRPSGSIKPAIKPSIYHPSLLQI